MEDYDIPGNDGLALHHFYRAMAWVGQELEERPKEALAPRCVKDEIEERLFARRRDLFSDLSVVFMDTTSLSFCTEMWPGNTADVATLLTVIDRLRQRFAIRRVCVVADRGMISAATIAGLEERRLEYILGARERSDAIAKAVVLKNKDPFVPLLIERKRGETQLFAKEVTVDGRRYVVCRNEAEVKRIALIAKRSSHL